MADPRSPFSIPELDELKEFREEFDPIMPVMAPPPAVAGVEEEAPLPGAGLFPEAESRAGLGDAAKAYVRDPSLVGEFGTQKFAPEVFRQDLQSYGRSRFGGENEKRFVEAVEQEVDAHRIAFGHTEGDEAAEIESKYAVTPEGRRRFLSMVSDAATGAGDSWRKTEDGVLATGRQVVDPFARGMSQGLAGKPARFLAGAARGATDLVGLGDTYEKVAQAANEKWREATGLPTIGFASQVLDARQLEDIDNALSRSFVGKAGDMAGTMVAGLGVGFLGGVAGKSRLLPVSTKAVRRMFWTATIAPGIQESLEKRGLSSAEALAVALPTAVASAAIEDLQVGRILGKAVPGKLMSAISGRLANVAAKAPGGVAGRFTAKLLGETVQESVQEVIQEVIESGAELGASQLADQKMTLGEFGNSLKTTFIESMKTMPLLLLGGRAVQGGVQMISDRSVKRGYKKRSASEVFNDLTELVEKDPKAFSAAAEKARLGDLLSLNKDPVVQELVGRIKSKEYASRLSTLLDEFARVHYKEIPALDQQLQKVNFDRYKQRLSQIDSMFEDSDKGGQAVQAVEDFIEKAVDGSRDHKTLEAILSYEPQVLLDAATTGKFKGGETDFIRLHSKLAGNEEVARALEIADTISPEYGDKANVLMITGRVDPEIFTRNDNETITAVIDSYFPNADRAPEIRPEDFITEEADPETGVLLPKLDEEALGQALGQAMSERRADVSGLPPKGEYAKTAFWNFSSFLRSEGKINDALRGIAETEHAFAQQMFESYERNPEAVGPKIEKIATGLQKENTVSETPEQLEQGTVTPDVQDVQETVQPEAEVEEDYEADRDDELADDFDVEPDFEFEDDFTPEFDAGAFEFEEAPVTDTVDPKIEARETAGGLNEDLRGLNVKLPKYATDFANPTREGLARIQKEADKFADMESDLSYDKQEILDNLVLEYETLLEESAEDLTAQEVEESGDLEAPVVRQGKTIKVEAGRRHVLEALKTEGLDKGFTFVEDLDAAYSPEIASGLKALRELMLKYGVYVDYGKTFENVAGLQTIPGYTMVNVMNVLSKSPGARGGVLGNMGHEALHSFIASNPEIREALVPVMKEVAPEVFESQMRMVKTNSVYDSYTEAEKEEEAAIYTAQVAMSTEQFWETLSEKEPSVAGKIKTFIKDVFEDIVGVIRTMSKVFGVTPGKANTQMTEIFDATLKVFEQQYAAVEGLDVVVEEAKAKFAVDLRQETGEQTTKDAAQIMETGARIWTDMTKAGRTREAWTEKLMTEAGVPKEVTNTVWTALGPAKTGKVRTPGPMAMERFMNRIDSLIEQPTKRQEQEVLKDIRARGRIVKDVERETAASTKKSVLANLEGMLDVRPDKPSRSAREVFAKMKAQERGKIRAEIGTAAERKDLRQRTKEIFEEIYAEEKQHGNLEAMSTLFDVFADEFDAISEGAKAVPANKRDAFVDRRLQEMFKQWPDLYKSLRKSAKNNADAVLTGLKEGLDRQERRVLGNKFMQLYGSSAKGDGKRGSLRSQIRDRNKIPAEFREELAEILQKAKDVRKDGRKATSSAEIRDLVRRGSIIRDFVKNNLAEASERRSEERASLISTSNEEVEKGNTYDPILDKDPLGVFPRDVKPHPLKRASTFLGTSSDLRLQGLGAETVRQKIRSAHKTQMTDYQNLMNVVTDKAAELDLDRDDALEWHMKPIEGAGVISTGFERVAAYGYLLDPYSRNEIMKHGFRFANQRGDATRVLSLDELASHLEAVKSKDGARFQKEMEFTKALMDAKSEYSLGKGNEVSRDVLGFDRFSDAPYFSLVGSGTGSIDTQAEMEKLFNSLSDQSPENVGALKEREGHGGPVVIQDALEVYKMWARDLTTFVGWANDYANIQSLYADPEFSTTTRNSIGSAAFQRMDELLKIMTYQTRVSDPTRIPSQVASFLAGRQLVFGPTVYANNRIGGKYAYITQLYADGDADTAQAVLKNVEGSSALRVTAGTLKKLVDEKAEVFNEEELEILQILEKNSAFLESRFNRNAFMVATGGFDSGVSEDWAGKANIAWEKAKNLHNKVLDAGFVPMIAAEQLNTIELFRALKENHSDWSDQQISERVEELTRRTQNPSDVIDATDGYIAAQKSPWVRILFPFMGQPSVAHMNLRRNILEAKQAKAAGNDVEAARKLQGGILGLVGQLAVSGLVAGLAGLLRDSFDDETKSKRARQAAKRYRNMHPLFRTLSGNVGDAALPGAGNLTDALVNSVAGAATKGRFDSEEFMLSGLAETGVRKGAAPLTYMSRNRKEARDKYNALSRFLQIALPVKGAFQLGELGLGAVFGGKEIAENLTDDDE